LTAEALPRLAPKIAAYVRDIDRGVCFRYPGEIVTVYPEIISKSSKMRWPVNNFSGLGTKNRTL